MKVLAILFLSIYSLLGLLACGVTGANSARPYTVGPTTGDLLQVSPGAGKAVNPTAAKLELEKRKNKAKESSAEKIDHNSENTTSEPEKKSSDGQEEVFAQNSFKNLSIEINLDESEIEGEQNNKAKVSLALKGTYNDSGIDKKILLNKKYYRFNPKTGHDILELKDEIYLWAFRLVDIEHRIQSDIFCKRKWSCKTVIVNMYWFEGNIVFYKQYLVKNTVQLLRSEVSESEDVESNSQDPEDDNSSDYDVVNDIDEHEELDSIEGMEVSDFVTPIHEEYFVEDNEPSEFAIEEQKISKQIEEQMIAELAKPVPQVLPMKDNISRINLKELAFQYSISNLNFNASEIPNQAVDQHDDGKLFKADQLIESYFGSAELNVPYVLKGYGQTNVSYGTTSLVNLIMASSNELETKYGDKLCIGDLSLEHGGKAPDHESHQNGLDADIYFYPKSPIVGKKCSFDATTSKGSRQFDVKKNYEFLKALYRNAQAKLERGQRFSYLYNIYLHSRIKNRICEYAYQVDKETVNKKGEVAYETLRRIINDKKNLDIHHHNHYHIRLNCHSHGCSDRKGYPLPSNNGCNL